MVVACVALFVALGGSAMAAYVVSSNSQVGPGTISGSTPPSGAHDNIIDGSISSADIKLNSLAGSRIADGSVTGADVGDGRLSGADLADNTLTASQIDESTLGQVP